MLGKISPGGKSGPRTGRLDAKVVVFGNFPDAQNGQAAFDELLAANVTELVETAGR